MRRAARLHEEVPDALVRRQGLSLRKNRVPPVRGAGWQPCEEAAA